ncbi:Abi-alpha family protein [Mycolicibacterium aubagnense]|uniref:DUF4393 domain-containing protein n=1 Tax=Mycolicibacterium aubagnense TaxID=319707 RepID=A0ABM7I9Q6_9MYCO|nr:Abi-alpha family protein [Mycolicibacterium aubagnense]TLH59675.1 hypothetical protein C1S80_19490 [Mycolicibacterium aubagnense]WGI34471.1 Abi-alpha family protein [Mycolicibacterium aubagnense]BBX83661.1 hypothetical protein MAUB_15340 [Mycolicibacterium aubagnense]
MVTTSDVHGLIGTVTTFARRGLRIAGNAGLPMRGVPSQGHAAAHSNSQSRPADGAVTTPNDVPQLNDALHTKMAGLLDRSVEQSTCETRLELYTRIVDQLVADEARILRALSDGTASPLVNVYSQSRWWSSPRAVLTNTSLIGRTAGVTLPTMVPTYVANLLQLGLVEIGPQADQSEAGYEVLMAEPSVTRAIADAEAARHSARVEQLSLRLSELGHELWTISMGNDSP